MEKSTVFLFLLWYNVFETNIFLFMKNKKFKLMIAAFVFIFVTATLAWQIPRVFAGESLTTTGRSIVANNQVKVLFSYHGDGLSVCDATKYHIDVNGGGVSPLNPISCEIILGNPPVGHNGDDYVLLTFSGTPWTAKTSSYAAEYGLYMDSGAVTDYYASATNTVVTHDNSEAIAIGQFGIASINKSNTTTLNIPYTEMIYVQGNPSLGWSVTDAVNLATTYAVSAVTRSGFMNTVTLTVADFSASAGNGVTATYDGVSHGTVRMLGGTEAPAESITLSEWQAPTLSSATVNSNTQITVTLNEVVSASTITKSNDGGFSVQKVGELTTYAVSAIAPGVTNAKVVLTVANMSGAATTGVTVTYSASGNGTVADSGGTTMATNETGVVASEFVPPTMSSATVDSNTQITVTLSEVAAADTITKSNAGGFVVTKTGTLTTYAVSSTAPGATNAKVVLTVADMSGAAATGVTVTYTASALPGGGTITDANGNELATNGTGITIAEFVLPTILSAVRK